MAQVEFDSREHIAFFEQRLGEIERWTKTHYQQIAELLKERDAIQAAIDALKSEVGREDNQATE